MKNIPSKFRNVTVVRELSVDTWKQVLQEAGCHKKIDLDKLSHDSVASFICETQAVEESLIDALKTIFCLGEDTGRGLIEQAAIDAGIDLNISDEESNRELAARIWVTSRTKRELLKLLARAQAAFEYSHKSTSLKEYVGERSFPLTDIDKARVKTMVSDWCKNNRKSGVVDIFVYNIESVWCCDIVRGDPIKRVAVISDEQQGELSYQPAVLDHVRVEPDSGRIGILTRSSTFAPLYREVFGEVLTGSPTFFSGEKICSLKPIQISGRNLLEENLPNDIHRISLTELRWRRGDQDNLIVKGRDCFKILNDLGAQLTVGELVEAKLQFIIAGVTRPIRVSVKVPNKIIISNEEYEPAINRYLDHVGIRGRFDNEDSKGFWELFPWHHTETIWRKHIGSNFDTLKSANCFHNLPLEAIRPPGKDSASGVMDVVSVERNDVIAIGDDDEVSLRTLTPSDYEGYKLDLPRLFNKLNNKLELIGTPRDLSGGLWQLGYRALSSTVTIQIYMATQEPDQESFTRIQQSINGYQPVLILPKGCSTDIGVSAVHLDITNLYFDDLIGAIVRSLKVENDVDPIIWCNADLIIDCKQNRMWYRGIQVENLDVNSHPFKLALMLAESPSSLVTKEDINSHLSPSNMDDGVAKKAKSDFLSKVRKSAKNNDRTELNESIKTMIRSPRGGYSMNCAVHIIN